MSYPVSVEITERTENEFGNIVIIRGVTVGTKKNRITIFETDSLGVAEAVERVALDAINALRQTILRDVIDYQKETENEN